MILKGVTNICWFFFKWGAALAIVAALAAAPFLYRKLFFRVEEELRTRVAAKIAERFPHLKVQVRSAHLMADGIAVRGLSIAEPDALGPQPQIVQVEEVFLACRTSLQELVAGEPVITSVKLSRPVLHATRRPDGSFSLAKLFPLPKYDHPVPLATIESGAVIVFDPLKNPSSTFALRDINLTLKRATAAAGGPCIDIQGYLVADQIQRVDFAGTLDVDGPGWTVAGTVDNLAISPELRAALPQRFSEPLEALSSLRASANLSFRVTGAELERVPRFEINGRVVQGRIDDPVLPYPVTDLQATLHCDNAGIRIGELTARHGATDWEVAEFVLQGFDARSPFRLSARGKQVRLDGRWANTLPAPWCEYWKNYSPEGEVDISCEIVSDGQRVRPMLQVTLLDNVSFSCHKFPYRLEAGRGTITLRDNALGVAITAYSGPRLQHDEQRDGESASPGRSRAGSAVTLKGDILNPGPQFTGWIEIKSDKIQFDDKLFAALLKPKARETLRSLNPGGTFEVDARLWRDDPRLRDMHQFAKITLKRCSLVYDKFPVPLANVQGVLHMQDGQWFTPREAPEIVGTNGTGVVRISGTLSTIADEDVLALSIRAENFPLHEELRDALSPSQRALWYSLQPHGKIDLSASVRYGSRVKKTTVELRAFPRDDASPIGTSIEPVAFPYRMRILGGSVHYQEGRAELENLQVAHGGTHMRTQGSCDLPPDGSWHLRLRDLSVDRLRLRGEDHELEAALPEALKHAITELKPGGPIYLKGAVDFSKTGPAAPLYTGWDVALFLHQGSLQVGPKLENIFGRVRLTGSSTGQQYSSRGELAVDSLTYKNFQFTRIVGPLWFDNKNVVLGNWGTQPRPPGQNGRHVTASLLGGALTADCHVKLGTVPRYHLLATVSQADLRQFAQDNLPNHQNLKGKILASVNLQGSGGARSLVGAGSIQLTDADVYELPVMVSLLKIARAKPPDATAFTQSDIAFAVQGEHITLNQINLNGDAISLSGHGELTLDGQTNPINLQLHTTVGRGNVPLLSGMLSEASQQIMVINVGGTLDHPTTRTEAFPGAIGALQQLQGESEQPTLLPRPGAIMRAIGLRR